MVLLRLVQPGFDTGTQNFHMGDWLQEEFQILKLHEAGYRYFSIDIIYSCGITETK